MVFSFITYAGHQGVKSGVRIMSKKNLAVINLVAMTNGMMETSTLLA